MYFPFDPGVVPMGFPDCFLHEVHTYVYTPYICMQGAGSLSPGHRRTRICLWNPYVTLCHPPPGACFRLSASGIPEQPLGITSDYIEFPLHLPWVVVFQLDFHVIPCTSVLTLVLFLWDSLVVSFMRSLHHVYTYIYMQGAGSLPPGHRRTRIGLWNPYVTL